MKILNFGSVNIDITYRVPHFVRPGETLSARSVTRNAGGKGFNQSVALARAGCEVCHAGHIGEDGAFLLDLCAKYGIRTDDLTMVSVPTGNAVIQVDDDGANCIMLYGGANQAMDIGFVGQVLSHFEKGDMIVLQNEINCMNEIMQMAHDAGLMIAINPAPMNDAVSKEALKLADWIILNETEAEELTETEEVFTEELAEAGEVFTEELTEAGDTYTEALEKADDVLVKKLEKADEVLVRELPLADEVFTKELADAKETLAEDPAEEIAAEEALRLEREYRRTLGRMYRDLSPEMQQMVGATIRSAYDIDKQRGHLLSQQEEEYNREENGDY